MAAAALLKPTDLSPEEYLRREEVASEKSEYIAGRLVAMAGDSANHAQVITNLGFAVGLALRGKACRFLSSETKVQISKGPRYFYPDGTISCPPNFVNRRSGVIDNPKVIFEVLSPGTEIYDRGEKFFAYAGIESVEQIVLVSSDEREVNVWTRVGTAWQPDHYSDDALPLTSIGVVLALDDLYEFAEFEPSSPPVHTEEISET